MEQIKEDDLKKIQELNNGETITVDFVKKHDTSKPQYKKKPKTKYTAELCKKDGGIYSYKIISKNKNIYYKCKQLIRNYIGNDSYLNTFILGNKKYLKTEIVEIDYSHATKIL